MTDKYRVPALYRANDVLTTLANHPNQYGLMDLVDLCHSNKSTMFTMLYTLEALGWVIKNKNGTYSLGAKLGIMSAAYFRQFNLIDAFHQEALPTVQQVNETAQLGILDERSVLYLAKEESMSLVQLVTNPGSRQPAHCTALGKSLLINVDYDTLTNLYNEYQFETPTENSISSIDRLWKEIEAARSNRYSQDLQENVMGFCCAASPIFNDKNQIIASVSLSMTVGNWKSKAKTSKMLVKDLARRISVLAGYTGDFFD